MINRLGILGNLVLCFPRHPQFEEVHQVVRVDFADPRVVDGEAGEKEPCLFAGDASGEGLLVERVASLV